MTNHHPNRLAVVLLACVALLCGSTAWAEVDQPAPDPAGEVRPPASERFRQFMLDTAGPVTLLEVAGWAGLAHVGNVPVEWGHGTAGYGKRFASFAGQNAVEETVTYGLSEALHVDSRFHKSRKHGFWPRASDALAQAVTSRRADGRVVISVPLLAGYAAGGMALARWYPDRYDYRDGLRFGAGSLTVAAGVCLVREFILRR
jgi:hypothetical protein